MSEQVDGYHLGTSTIYKELNTVINKELFLFHSGLDDIYHVMFHILALSFICFTFIFKAYVKA